MNFKIIVKDERPLEGLEGFSEGFLKDRLKEYNDLLNFLETQNYQEIRALSHKWKGFCEPYGFQKLGDLSAHLEEASKKENVNEITQTIDQIKQYLDAKREYIF